MSEATVPFTANPYPQPQPRQPMPRWLFAFLVFDLALLAGCGGAVLVHYAFPPSNGKAGAVGPPGAPGKQGPAGAPGPAGATAAAPVVNTGKLGYCFNYNLVNNGTGTVWINSVSLFPPTDNQGTLSCTSGQFISLTPDGPNGVPVSTYNPSGS